MDTNLTQSNIEKLVIKKNYSHSFILTKIFRRLPMMGWIGSNFNKYRSKKIQEQLTPLFEYTLSSFREEKKSAKNQYLNNTIWFFWWQGEDKLTPLSSKCYASIIRNKGHRKVVLISKKNISEYIKLPKYIYYKLENQQISVTHFSDIVRFGLLEKYGGLWVDATIYVTDNLDKFKTDKFIFCSGYPVDRHFNVALGRWTSFFIGGPPKSKIFKFMKEFYLVYWKNNNQIIDYFMMDYALNFGFDHNLSEFQSLSQKYENIAPNMFKLQPLLNKTFDEKVWEKIQKDNSIFKLSNRKKIKLNKKSFYSVL